MKWIFNYISLRNMRGDIICGVIVPPTILKFAIAMVDAESAQLRRTIA